VFWGVTTSGEDCDDTLPDGKYAQTDCTKVDWIIDKDGDGAWSQSVKKYPNWNSSEVGVPDAEFWKKKSDLPNAEGIDCKDDDPKYKYANLSVSLTVNNSSQVGTGADFQSGDLLNFQGIHDVINGSDLEFGEKIEAHKNTYFDELYDKFMDEDDYIKNLRDFAEWTTFNDDLVNEMIYRFLQGDSSGHYTSNNLTQAMLESDGYDSFRSGLIRLIKDKIINDVTKGNRHIIITDLGGPTFDTNGGLFSWNGSHSSNLEVSNFVINCNTFSMTATLTMYDHFGLDNTDLYSQPFGLSGVAEFIARRSKAIRGWFILQRVKGYKPFISEVTTSINISNESF